MDYLIPMLYVVMVLDTSSGPIEWLVERAHALGLHGLVLHWSEAPDGAWLEWLIEVEEQERRRRSLERRQKNARLGRYNPLGPGRSS